jgi:hypothetical protein
MDPFARAKANCETNTVMMQFYDCACYAQKTAQAMQERGIAPPAPYQSKGTTASEVINDPKMKEYQAAVGRYNQAYGEAATAAAATTACISDAGISKYVLNLVNQVDPRREKINGDCVVEAMTRQYRAQPRPNDRYVQQVLSDIVMLGTCRR